MLVANNKNKLEEYRMNIRHLLIAVVTVPLMYSASVIAQSHDASIANHQPH